MPVVAQLCVWGSPRISLKGIQGRLKVVSISQLIFVEIQKWNVYQNSFAVSPGSYFGRVFFSELEGTFMVQ